MKDEVLIEQIAELRALAVVNTFHNQFLLEMLGSDAEALVTVTDKMLTEFANRFEAQMRKACDMEPRAEPRTPTLPKLAEMDLLRNTDWTKVREQ
ncbi:MAG: hypothetical protein QM785_14320 [Pyrinomonadaceae bacterium]